MKRAKELLTLVLCAIAISCNPLKDISVKSITGLYDGVIGVARGVQASTSRRNESYLKLTVEENGFITSGWLLPESMANNCAILLAKENPNFYDKIDLLQIEVSNANLFEYRRNDLKSESLDYDKVEKILHEFVGTLGADKIDEAVRFMKSDSSANLNYITEFMKSVKSVLPGNPKATNLIGYRQINQSQKRYEVDFVVISQDDVHRMLKATLEESENALRFLNITI